MNSDTLIVDSGGALSTTTDSGTRIDLRKGRRLIGGTTSEETSEQVELLKLQECGGFFLQILEIKLK